MEQLTLAAPVSLTTYSVRRVLLDWADTKIKIVVMASNGDVLVFLYSGAPATSLMVALNKANLSTISLHARILNQLVLDGKLPAGNITGVPD